MQTFVQIQNGIWTQLKEDSSDSNFWSPQEVKDALNDTYMSIADKTLLFRLEKIIEIRAGIRKYKLPADYILGSLNRVEFDSEIIYPITATELDSYNRQWRNTQGSDIWNYFAPGDISNTDEIAVYPLPDTDGAAYNLASTSKDYGVITTVGDDTFEEFERDEGVIIATTGDPQFIEVEGSGPVFEIDDPENNLRVYGARYPKRLFDDDEVFLHPISDNPRKILTNGAMSILLQKEGEGKDIAKASFYNKRFEEIITTFLIRPKVKRIHVVKSITDSSIGTHGSFGRVRLGDNYPAYPVR